MNARILVFDIDGVLVDPTETFRQALIDLVDMFADVTLTQNDIVRIKNRGGFNDDSDIAAEIIRNEGIETTMDDIRRCAHDLYWGDEGDGLIQNERWLARPGTLERLAEDWRLAIFTGRGMASTEWTLGRFCPAIAFDPIITHEQVERRKPAPDGLLEIAARAPGAELVFVGDNIDDCHAANGAGARFIGIASPATPRHEETRALFEQLGAETVLESVNGLEAWLG